MDISYVDVLVNTTLHGCVCNCVCVLFTKWFILLSWLQLLWSTILPFIYFTLDLYVACFEFVATIIPLNVHFKICIPCIDDWAYGAFDIEG
mgnify:CR=1 FL=1